MSAWLFSALCLAAPTFPVAGHLADASGAPVDGARSVVFNLYDAASGGDLLWTEPTTITFVDGAFAALLGASAALPEATLANPDDLFLTVTLGGVESAPSRVGWAPRALWASWAGHAATADGADQLGGAPRAAFVERADLGAGLALTGSTVRVDGVPWSALSTADQPAHVRDGYAVGSGLTLDGTELSFDAAWSGAPFVRTDDAAAALAGSVRLGQTAETDGCGTSTAGTIRWSGNKFQGCNGTDWVRLDEGLIGATKAAAGTSCRVIKADQPNAVDGLYWIDPNGAPTADAFRVYCDMTTDGGGWIVAFNVKSTDTSTSLHTSTGTYLHTDAKCADPSITTTFSCVTKLDAANYEALMTNAEVMWYLVHADAPSAALNPWLKSRITDVKSVTSLFTAGATSAQRCNDGSCSAMLAALQNGANVSHNRWYKDGSPTRVVAQVNASSIAHVYNEASGNRRCNADFDRIHVYLDSYVGLAYYANGGTNDCYYDTADAKKLFSRMMLRDPA